MVLLPFGVLALAAAFQEPAVPAEAAGSWSLDVPQELRTLSKKIGLPEPFVKIKVQPDGTFVYRSILGMTTLETKGHCTARDGKITFASDEAFPFIGVKELIASMKGDTIEINGGVYRKFNASDVAGLWTLRSNGKEDGSISLNLTKDGKFEFKMSGAKSSGKFSLTDSTITLNYELVDGSKVTGMSRTIVLDVEAECIVIDGRFRYRRSGTA